MFDAFDKFLDRDSWASLHWSDMDRFYQAIDVAARLEGFSPAALGKFLNEQHRMQFGGAELKVEIRRTLEERADIIQRFLQATHRQNSTTA